MLNKPIKSSLDFNKPKRKRRVQSLNIIKKDLHKKDFPYATLVNYLLKSKKSNEKSIAPSITNFPLIFGFITKYGNIKARRITSGVSLKKYRNTIKVLKRARQLKILPFTYQFFA
jgi:ribosomal protein S18